MKQGLFGIGVDVDQYNTYPEVQSSLLTSAMKVVDVSTGDAVTAFAAGELEGGINLGTITNDGVGLASFHDQDGSIDQACKDAVVAAEAGLADGSIDTGYSP